MALSTGGEGLSRWIDAVWDFGYTLPEFKIGWISNVS